MPDSDVESQPAVPQHLRAYHSEANPPEEEPDADGVRVSMSDAASEPGSERAPDAEEVSRLRKELAEKEMAKLRALLSAADLKRQLNEAKQEATILKAHLKTVSEMNAAAPAAPDTQSDRKKAAEAPDHTAPDPKREAARKAEEIERLKLHHRRLTKEIEREHQSRKMELASVRTQFYQTQKLLESEHRARTAEASHAAVQLGRMEQELVTARTEVAAALKQRVADRRNWLIAGAGVAAAIVLGFVVFLSRQAVSPQGVRAAMTATAAGDVSSDSTSRVPISDAPGAVPRPQQSASAESVPQTDVSQDAASKAGMPRQFASQQAIPQDAFPQQPISQLGFQQALGRLNHSLEGFPGKSPEFILRDVHARNAAKGLSVCAFQWNSGQPAMLFSGASSTTPLSDAVRQCADAVEKSR